MLDSPSWAPVQDSHLRSHRPRPAYPFRPAGSASTRQHRPNRLPGPHTEVRTEPRSVTSERNSSASMTSRWLRAASASLRIRHAACGTRACPARSRRSAPRVRASKCAARVWCLAVVNRQCGAHPSRSSTRRSRRQGSRPRLIAAPSGDQIHRGLIAGERPQPPVRWCATLSHPVRPPGWPAPLGQRSIRRLKRPGLTRSPARPRPRSPGSPTGPAPWPSRAARVAALVHLGRKRHRHEPSIHPASPNASEAWNG